MKPPPRTRTKKTHDLKPDPVPLSSSKVVATWKRAEQRKLLDALKNLRRTTSVNDEIDFAYLRKYIPTRSISEIQSVVESLKESVVSCANSALKKKRYEENKRKPIDAWTHMASALSGLHEEHISTAFSQMLVVSSTEPRTLMNSDPHHVNRHPEGVLVGRTLPLRPEPHLPVNNLQPGTSQTWPHQVVKTLVPTAASVPRVPNSKHLLSTQPLATTTSTPVACHQDTAKELLLPLSAPKPGSETLTPVRSRSVKAELVEIKSGDSSVIQNTPKHPIISTTSAVKSTSPQTPQSFSATRIISTTYSSATTSSHSVSPPLSTLAATDDHSKKYGTNEIPRILGAKWAVDFEKIYRYLSVILKPNEECHLTPMESAVILDLLMSLPEELPLLECKKLHEHLNQVYCCFSSSADSKRARDKFKDLMDGLGAPTEAPPSQNSSTTDGQHYHTTVCGDSANNSHREQPQVDEAETQLSESNNASSHSHSMDVKVVRPPLNPFMIPLKLLVRR